jgi:hypothetical protein
MDILLVFDFLLAVDDEKMIVSFEKMIYNKGIDGGICHYPKDIEVAALTSMMIL